MPDTDEYDAFYSPIEHQDLVDIEATALASYTLRQASISTPEPQSTQKSLPESSSSDEFDSYDFSEFTAEDFEHIDALVLAHTPDMSTTPVNLVQAQPPSARRGGYGRGGRSSSSSRRGGWNGGPRVEIGLEGATSADSRRRFKGPSRRTPFQQFRSWNGVLSVTDLVGPSWCEVQFDYGLRQKRSRKLEDRPTSFVTADGKTITVVQDVAAQNDRTVTRGKSVHKVLEREVQPEAVSVDITIPEERWGLRLINMLASLQTLMTMGFCREMPVFGVVQGQVVTGIIDEIARKPIQTNSEPEDERVGTSSPNKRGAPSTPSKPAAKKSKHDEAKFQPQITSFFSPGKRASTPPPAAERPPNYSLHLSDTKTRTKPTLPPHEDTLASRVQLMLYHRLLSNLLTPTAPSVHGPEPIDFAALWGRVGVDPTRRFSEGFLVQAGLAPPKATEEATAQTTPTIADLSVAGLTCLNDLTAAWAHAVDALDVATVDNTLTLVYRSQPSRRRKGGSPKPVRTELSDQEVQTLAAAVQASVSDAQGEDDGDPDLARAIFESLKDSLSSGKAAEGDLGFLTHPFGVPISEAPGSTALKGELQVSERSESSEQVPAALEDDPELAWAIQQSLLSRIEDTPAVQEAVAGSETSAVHTSGPSATDAVSNAPIDNSADATPVAAEETRTPEGGTKTAPPSPARSDELVEADETMTVAELNVEARVIGTKDFQLDDALLDGYLARVLAWWHGEREPEGVSVELTRRCMSCEYREGCEWREKKAQEAAQKYHASVSQSAREQSAALGA